MREAIGNSLLLNIVVVIVGIVSVILINSIAYSKAFKAKNRIISVIDSYNGNCAFNSDSVCFKDIEGVLTNMGYSSNIVKDCPGISLNSDDKRNKKIVSVDNVYSGDGGHKYCVYKYTMCIDDIKMESADTFSCVGSEVSYYKVITFMHFDIPVIGKFLEFQVSGESKTYYDTIVSFSEDIVGEE